MFHPLVASLPAPLRRTHSRAVPGLVSCEYGAVSLAGVFMTLFLIAMLYVMIGIGRTLMMREGLQDAADAAAFSSAIFHARGMNLLVFLNILMAALVAVLVAIRLAQTLCYIAAAALLAMAWISMGSTAGLAAPLMNAGQTLGRTYKTAKRVVQPMLTALHSTQRAVSVVVPWVASVDSMVEAAKYHPPAKGAFTPPRRLSLPVEPDEFSVLCGRATGFAVTASLELFPVPLPNWLTKKLDGAANKMGEGLSKFLCGSGDGPSPSHTETISTAYPTVPGMDACEDESRGAECEQATAEMRDASPDEHGECQTDCAFEGGFESRARAARLACEPRDGFRPDKYFWTEDLVEIEFTFRAGEWVETKQSVRESRYDAEGTSRPPCSRGGTINEDEWNKDSGPKNAEFITPLCREEMRGADTGGKEGETRTEKLWQATRIFGCTVEVKRTYPTASKEDAIGGEGSESRSPYKVEDDLELGNEAFQIRALAFGDAPGPGSAEAGVRLALPARERSQESSTPESSAEAMEGLTLGAASAMSHLSVAQAEYYFDHAGAVPRAEWMWTMNWTARLKRFRMPTAEEAKKETHKRNVSNKKSAGAATENKVGSSDGSLSDNCAKAGGTDCEKTGASLDFLSGLVLH